MKLQQIFIANLKKFRKLRGISQMTLSELCDMGGNYIGQIEMGRRIPSFEKIEKIAASLKIPSYELFMYETGENKEEKDLKTGDYLQKLPYNIKKDIISHLLAAINNDVKTAFESQSYCT